MALRRDNESGARRFAMMALRGPRVLATCSGRDYAEEAARREAAAHYRTMAEELGLDPRDITTGGLRILPGRHAAPPRKAHKAKETATMSKTSTPVNALFTSTSNGQANPATDPAAFLAAKAAAGPTGECGITAAQFLAEAKPITVIVNGQTLIAMPKQFSTGSFGYYLGDKAAIEVCGRPVRLQLGLNATVIGSNPNPKK